MDKFPIIHKNCNSTIAYFIGNGDSNDINDYEGTRLTLDNVIKINDSKYSDKNYLRCDVCNCDVQVWPHIIKDNSILC